MYYDSLGSAGRFVAKVPAENPLQFHDNWSFVNRKWQDLLWASDVTSFAWSPDGFTLYIATSDVYGLGKLFEIDLRTRMVSQVAPADSVVTVDDPGLGYVITSIKKKNWKPIL